MKAFESNDVVELFVEDEANEERSWAEDWNFELILPLLGRVCLRVLGFESRAGQMCLLVNFWIASIP